MPALCGAAKAPTLIYTTGGEGWAEHAYFWVGAGRSRGYNIVAVDLPIHMGSRLRYPDLPLRDPSGAIDAPLKAILDYTVQRLDVDRDRALEAHEGSPDEGRGRMMVEEHGRAGQGGFHAAHSTLLLTKGTR